MSIDNVCKVYCHITGGRMSNPRYYAEDVIALADDVTNNTVNENCKEFMDSIIECGKFFLGEK